VQAFVEKIFKILNMRHSRPIVVHSFAQPELASS